MNLKLLMGREKVEDAGLASILKPIVKSGVKKLAKSSAKKAAKSGAKSAAKGVAKEGAKSAVKGASESVLSKYLSKISNILENVDPEDVAKAGEMGKNIMKIIKALKSGDVKEEDADKIADLIVGVEDKSDEILSKEDSNKLKDLLDKIIG